MLNLFKPKKEAPGQPFQLSHLVEILQDGVCITNVTGEVLYLNKAAYTLLNVDKSDDLSQINFLEHCIRDEQQVDWLKQKIHQNGLVKNHELRLNRITDGLLDVILTVNIIGDFRQQTIGFLFLFKDITEMKKIQQQLLQSQKLESIGLMASGIAHDFNNILAAIIPNAELIKISGKPNDVNYRRAEIIEKSAHRASDIAQRLLTFTRRDEKSNYMAIDLNRILHDSLELLEHSIPENVVIHTHPNPELKYFKGDEAQLQQIIMNLVINAIDAMPQGGSIQLKSENFRITNYYQVGSLDPGDYVHLHLSIHDSGTGIPMELLPKIFDPFFTTKEIGKGTGLGLSVVYGIVKGMKGHIEVDSRMNQGTRFDLYFPVDSTLARPVSIDHKQQREPRDLQLLLIDDEDYVLNILGDILEFLGYRVIKKNNSQEAIEYYREHKDHIDYVIVDLKMPKMDGRATSAELSKIDKNVKIIITSGFDDNPAGNEQVSGLVGILKKPYSINQVAKSHNRPRNY